MSTKRANAATTSSNFPIVAGLAAMGAVVLVWLAWAIGISLTGGAIEWNPFAVAIKLATGKLPWPMLSTFLLAALGGGAALTAVLLVGRGRPKSSTARATQAKAAIMPTPRETTGLVARDIKKTAAQLYPSADMSQPDDWGMYIGDIAGTKTATYLSWESVGTIVAGPRNGKTQAYAIPNVAAAPGAALVTSNKRDIHDGTRLSRQRKGKVWVSDLQRITGEHGGQEWWWNPLRGISTIKDAQRVGSYFVSATREDGPRGTNEYFDSRAQDLLAGMLLAAAISGGDLLHVYGWLSEPDRTLPETLLTDRNQEIAAAMIRTARNTNQRQRDGFYDMARNFLAVLGDPEYAASVVPVVRHQYPAEDDSAVGRISPHDWLGTQSDREEFIADEFVATTDTLYAMSMEGPDAATPLTTALVGVVIDAAVRRARRSPGGRLPRPLMCILDEAANVCKLRELPGWYSHLGSQGIVVLTFLQSLDQAAKVWGADGVGELVKASNLLLYGGGGKDLSANSQFLSMLSQMIGQHDVARWSRSTSGGASAFGGASQSQQWSREPKFTIDELAALDKGYAIASFSNNSALLLTKRFWSDGPHAADIRRSFETYGNPGTETAESYDGDSRSEVPA